MKKTKKVVVAIMVAILGILVFGLVSCTKDTVKLPDNPSTPVATYTITFDANGGEFEGNKETVEVETKEDGTVVFPTAPKWEDYTFEGYTANKDGTGGAITASKVFTGNTIVYAQWKDDSNKDDNFQNDNNNDDDDDVTDDDNNDDDVIDDGDDDITNNNEETAAVYINGQKQDITLLPGTDGADTKPENLIFNYYANGVTLEKGDTVKFVIDGVTISKVWAKGGSAIVGVTSAKDDQGVNISGDTVTVLADGTYTISVSQYQDQVGENKVSIYIGAYAGPWDNNTDPDKPGDDKTGDGNYILVGETKHELSEGSDPDWVLDYYVNEVTLTKGQIVKFVLDGKTIAKMWAEKATVIVGVTATDGKEITGDTITVLADGKYNISIKQSEEDAPNNKYVIYIGPYSGEYEDGGNPDKPKDDKEASGLYLKGDLNGWESVDEYQFVAMALGDDMTEQYMLEFTLTKEHIASEKTKVKIYRASDDVWGEMINELYVDGTKWNPSSNGKYDYDITLPGAGTYQVYYKVYDSWIRVDFVYNPYFETTTTVPQGTPFVLKGTDGKTITLYLLDTNGNAVTNLSSYKMWAWNGGGDLFASWNTRPTVSETVNATGELGDKCSLKFTYGANSATESSNFNGLQSGKTYVISLKDMSCKELKTA